jgi:hypothetical protein
MSTFTFQQKWPMPLRLRVLRICSDEVLWQITVTAQSEASTGFARSNAGIVGSNPTKSTGIWVRLLCVCVDLCVGSGLATF